MRSFRVSVGAGLVVLALALVSGALARPRPCGGLPTSYPPMVAFELARDAGDLRALFGDGPSACRTALVEEMDRANLVDIALFTPAYCVFLIGFFVGVRARGPALARAGIALALVAGITDWLEDVCLLALTPELDAGSPWLPRLIVITSVKWLALGAAGAVGAVILARGGRAAKVGAVLAAIAPIGAVAAVAQPARFGPVLAGAIAASWIAFLVVAVAGARRPPAPA